MSKAKYTTAEVLKKLLVSDDEHDSSDGDDDGSEVSDLEESSDSSSAENESDMDTLASTSAHSSAKTDLLTSLQWKSNCANAPVAPVFSAITLIISFHAWHRGIGATTLWDPWDASPSTFEQAGTAVDASLPTFEHIGTVPSNF